MFGSAMTLEAGNKRLSEIYGNPKAVFPENNNEVPIGTKVKVFPLGNEGQWLDGKVVRGKGGKKHIRVSVNGKTRFLLAKNCQFLLEW